MSLVNFFIIIIELIFLRKETETVIFVCVSRCKGHFQSVGEQIIENLIIDYSENIQIYN